MLQAQNIFAGENMEFGEVLVFMEKEKFKIRSRVISMKLARNGILGDGCFWKSRSCEFWKNGRELVSARSKNFNFWRE